MLIFSNCKNYHIGFFGSFNSLFNKLQILLTGCENDVIIFPVEVAVSCICSQLAALSKQYLRLFSDFLCNTFKQTYLFIRFACITAEIKIFCTRADNCNFLILVFRKRQQVTFVFEQNY